MVANNTFTNKPHFPFSMAPRTRSFVFTLNNYTEDDIKQVRQLDFVYLIFGYEVGESNTKHLQGFIHFENALRFSTLKKLLPKAHWEIRKGTIDQAAEYCKKDGQFEEYGEKPASQESKGAKAKETWTAILKNAEEGKHDWIKENYPKVWCNLSNRLENLRKPNTTILDGELQHEWWIGNTGTGKSRTVWELYPDHYQKELNKWWCGYKDEDVVVIEEWSPKNECTGSQLKIWGDRYPFTGQIKGGSLKKIRPTKIIVLSNYSISECFPCGQDSEPIKRRFQVFRFPQDIEDVRRSHGDYLSARESLATTVPNTDDYELSDDLGVALDFGISTESPFDGCQHDDWQSYATHDDIERLLSLECAEDL